MTRTVADSFSLTHAKYLASKVTADMRRCQGLYGQPTDIQINNYGTELAILLRDGYVSGYEFGFQKDSKRILSWLYSVDISGTLTADDRPGKIAASVNVVDAYPFNQLTYSSKWTSLTATEREKINEGLPIRRATKDGPSDGLGYWTSDLCYSANGVAMPRKTFRLY